nr:CD82 antigen [Misgurnus anguillicaudatus]
MKADDKLQILKFFLMLVNSVFVILGISIFACSAWILFDNNNFIRVISSGEEVKLVAGGLFFIGLVVVGVSLLGCIGAYLESRCFIISYLGFLIIIILGQIFITFVLLIRRESINKYLSSSVEDIINKYGQNKTHETLWSLLDSVQSTAKCCGWSTPNEWRNNTVISSLNEANIYPCSCFNGTCPLIIETVRFGNGSNIYKTGCEKVLGDWLNTNIIVIFGMDAGLLLIQVLQFIFGVHTYKSIGCKTRELHPKKLLNAVDESPSTVPVQEQYEDQTNNTQMNTVGHNNGEYIHGGYNNGGYDHVAYNQGGHIADNYDLSNNPEFYEQDNRQSYNLEYQQGYSGSHDQGYIQRYNGDDY